MMAKDIMRADVILIKGKDTLIRIVAYTAKYRLMVIPVTRDGTFIGTLFAYIGKVPINEETVK